MKEYLEARDRNLQGWGRRNSFSWRSSVVRLGIDIRKPFRDHICRNVHSLIREADGLGFVDSDQLGNEGQEYLELQYEVDGLLRVH